MSARSNIRLSWMVALAASGLAAAAQAAPKAAHPDLSGVWEMKFREFVYTDEGKLPPMRPEALCTSSEVLGQSWLGFSGELASSGVDI